jgi:hypothetical protein
LQCYCQCSPQLILILLDLFPDSQEFLSLIWGGQRSHIRDVAAVELLCCCSGRINNRLDAFSNSS